MPVNGVRPVWPSAKLSNPTVSRLMPAVDVITETVLPADSAGNEDGRHPTPTECDTSVDADGSAAVACLESEVEVLTMTAFPAAVATPGKWPLEVSAVVTLPDDNLLPVTAADTELTATVLPIILLPTVDGPQCVRCVASINSSSSFSFRNDCISSFSLACSASSTCVS